MFETVKGLEVGKNHRGELIKELDCRQYTGCDFSHAVIDANLSNKQFHNCIFYNTDFTGADIDRSTRITQSGYRNPLTSKKSNGEPLAKFTDEQLLILKSNHRER